MKAQYAPLIVGISSLALTDAEAQVLRHPLISGVILFARNFQDKNQLKALCVQLHALKSDFKVYVDQEGGRVQRFRDGFSSLAPLGQLGVLYQTMPKKALIAAKEHAYLMAHELKEVGVDQSFAPVVDLDLNSRVIGDRAFAHDPHVVIELARAYIEGMQDAGMRAILKHFPGHGFVTPDTHVDFAIDERHLHEVEQLDLLPFIELMQHQNVLGVMMSHVVFKNIDAEPVSLSSYWINDFLRRRLQFKGKIFSDDLGMKAVSALGSGVVMSQRALVAGCDYVLLCNDWQVVLDAVKALS